MKSKSSKIKQPINLADNFRTVKSRKSNSNRLKFMIGVTFVVLILALSPFFLLPRISQTNIYDDNIEIEKLKENIDTQYNQYTDVNEIIRYQKNEVELHKPANKQKFEVKVNVKPSYRETLKESRTSNVKVDKQKIDEFFHPASKKSSVSSPVIEDNFEGLPESVFPPETSVHSVSGNTSSHHSYSEENIDDFPTENQE